jgi:hypothetical protein
MLRGLLGTITSEAERRHIAWLQDLAGNGVEHTDQLAGKLEQLQQSGAAPRQTSAHAHLDAGELLRVAEQLARTISQGRPLVAEAPAERLPVYVNQDEVLDILGNLILNANRFAPPMTPIQRRGHAGAARAHLRRGGPARGRPADRRRARPRRRHGAPARPRQRRRAPAGRPGHGRRAGALRAVAAAGAGLRSSHPEVWRLFGPVRHPSDEPHDPALEDFTPQR